MCDYVVVKRDLVEQFVLRCVRETLQNEDMLSLVEHKLQALLDVEPDNVKMKLDQLTKEVHAVEGELERILIAIENGAPAHLFNDRIVTLENEKKRIQWEVEETNRQERRSVEISEVAGMVREFAANFEDLFESAPLAERKDLIRRCVSRIVVEHEPKVVRCFVRRIPLVNSEIAGILEGVGEGDKTPMATLPSPLVITGVAGTETTT